MVPSNSVASANSIQWRVHHCALLSGDWRGSSFRVDPLTGQTVETVWSQTKMFWDAHTGKITGEGRSIWQEQAYPFEIVGAFSQDLQQIELLKTHRTLGSVTHLAFGLDLNSLTLTGNFVNGGSCTLQRLNSMSPPASQSQSQPSQQPSSNATGPGSVFPPPSSSQLLARSNIGMGVPDAPKDLLTFLSYCFSDSPGIAAKIHATLQENEIHDPESLTTLSHEEWREIGIVLGHRSKIKLQLQRFFPHLMKMQQEELNSAVTNNNGSGPNGASPTHASGGANDVNVQVQGGVPSASPYHSHGGMMNAGSYGSVLPSAAGSHYVSASQSLYSNVPPTFASGSYGTSNQPPPQAQPSHPHSHSHSHALSSSIPLDYKCPITHDLMDDPVTLSDGYSYDRLAIARWLEHNKTSPITGKILPTKMVQPNLQLRKEIQQWRQQNLGGQY